MGGGAGIASRGSVAAFIVSPRRVAVHRSRNGAKGVGCRRRESTAIADALNRNGAKGVGRYRFIVLIGFDVCECFVSAVFDMLYSSISRPINMS